MKELGSCSRLHSLRMYAKTCAVAFIAVWLFNATLAAPAPEPEPEAEPNHCGCIGCGDGCGITKIQAFPISSHIPIKTTHKILSDNNCGGWNNGYYGGCGWDSGCGSWGNGHYGGLIGGSGWDSGCGGWGDGYHGGLIGGYGWDSGSCDSAVSKIHHVPLVSHVPIKTTHKIIPSNNCGVWGSYGNGYGNGYGCGCGCNSWW